MRWPGANSDALLRPHVVEFLDFGRSNIGPHVTMEQVRVPPKTESVHQLWELLNSEVVVLAIRKEGVETIFNPPHESC